MIPKQTLENYPVFGDNATKVQPDNAKMAAGFQQADVLPAEWMNWAWAKNSKGIADLNAGVSSMETELVNVVDAAGLTPAEATNNQVITAITSLIATAKAEAILAAHPVGSLYWTSKNENPSVTFGGGTWAQIKDKFILAAGDTYENGGTGGAATVTLTSNQMPSHTHTFSGTANQSTGNTQPTFTGSAVTSGGSSAANTGSESSHTHGMTHNHPNATATTVAAGGHTHRVMTFSASIRAGIANMYAPWSESSDVGNNACLVTQGSSSVLDINDQWSNLPTGTSSGAGYNRYGNFGGKKDVSKRRSLLESDGSHTHSVTVSIANSATTTTGTGSSHNHSMAHTHSVTASGTVSSHSHTYTAAGTNSNTGGGAAHENMPPYIVKYCWERTA